MTSRGYGYLLLLDRVGQVGGSVEHSEGKGRESAMAIPRFLCGSPRLMVKGHLPCSPASCCSKS
jgi:hypothetical protein